MNVLSFRRILYIFSIIEYSLSIFFLIFRCLEEQDIRKRVKKNKGCLTYAMSHSRFDATSIGTLQWFRFMLCTIFMYYKAECLRVTIDKWRLPKRKKNAVILGQLSFSSRFLFSLRIYIFLNINSCIIKPCKNLKAWIVL